MRKRLLINKRFLQSSILFLPLLLSACSLTGGDKPKTTVSEVTAVDNSGSDTGNFDAASNVFKAQLHYRAEIEAKQKRVLHRAELRDTAAVPLNRVIDYQWTFTLPADFHDGSLSLSTASWRNADDKPLLQISVARGRFWAELFTAQGGEPIYKPFPVGLVKKGVPQTLTASIVWSTDPAAGRILLWCNGRSVLRYRGANLTAGSNAAPQAAPGLRYEGSGKALTAVKGVHGITYADYRRRIGTEAGRLPPPPPVTIDKRHPALDRALEQIVKPVLGDDTKVPASDLKVAKSS